jgi:hypothetical protein
MGSGQPALDFLERGDQRAQRRLELVGDDERELQHEFDAADRGVDGAENVVADSVVVDRNRRRVWGVGVDQFAKRALDPVGYLTGQLQQGERCSALLFCCRDLQIWVELPGIEPASGIALNCGNAKSDNAKRRESTRNDLRIRERC